MANNPTLQSVPDDFPGSPGASSLSGAQPKIDLVSFAGRFYSPGNTPLDRFVRWETCEDFARRLSVPARESKFGKRSHMSEESILAQYLPRITAMGWASEDECRWIVRRMAAILGWPIPPVAANNP